MAATELRAAALVGAHGFKAPQSWNDTDAMCFCQLEHVQEVNQESIACVCTLESNIIVLSMFCTRAEVPEKHSWQTS